MNYKERIFAQRNGASQNYNSFGSASDFNGFGMANELDPNDRTLTFNIINSDTAAAATVRLFGAVKDLTDSTLPAALAISVLESSHLEVKTQLLSDPFRILGMKMMVVSNTQFTNTWTIYRQHSTGATTYKKFQPFNYRAAANNLTDQVDAADFDLIVDKNTYVEFSVNPSENITIIFNIGERANMTKVMTGATPREIARQNAPTGIPVIDMQAVNILKK